jgi:hypothetical protein
LAVSKQSRNLWNRRRAILIISDILFYVRACVLERIEQMVHGRSPLWSGHQVFAKQHRFLGIIAGPKQSSWLIREMAVCFFAALDAYRTWLLPVTLLFPSLATVACPAAP